MNKPNIFIIFLFLTLGFSQAKSQTVIDEVVAIVGKNNIKLSDIEQRLVQLRIQQGNEFATIQRCEILEDILINKLILHKANIDSTVVTAEQAEASADEQLRNLIRRYGSKENIEKEAKRPYDELREHYIEVVRENMLIQQAEQSITENVKVTPKEVSEYFNKIPKDSIPFIEGEYEFSQIVKTPSINEEERNRVKLELNKLRERVLKGESFATLATLYSLDLESAKRGGELGLFSRGDMVREFEVAAFALKPGEVSPVVETKFGFHIIQLIERRGDLINARHILLIPKPSPEDLYNARLFMDSIAGLIKNNTISFDDAVEKFSDEPSKKALINPYTLNSRFTDDIAKQMLPGINYKTMKTNDISPVHLIKDDQNKDAYRIVQLKLKTEEHKANLVDDYDKIYNIVLQSNKTEALLKWGENTIKKSYIWISDDYKDCDFKLNWFKKGK
ncbi:peptidylprolyl isomerase [Bacteroidales bacterium OttesenSCG-928-C19]|nr:peptidylprolyl isomerase [Bacteroidales bacterium OttesenSCG-928-C19]